jgi:hypothetical protein
MYETPHKYVSNFLWISVPAYHTTWCYIPEDRQHCENLKSQSEMCILSGKCFLNIWLSLLLMTTIFFGVTATKLQAICTCSVHTIYITWKSNRKILYLLICMIQHQNCKTDFSDIWYWTGWEEFYTKVMMQLFCWSIMIKCIIYSAWS